MSSKSSSLISVAPSLDEPLEMLYACHGRLLAQLDTLERLLGHLQRTGADAAAAQAATAIKRYFDQAAPHHHEDEEEDLLPAMQPLIGADERKAFGDLAERISREHRLLEMQWDGLRISLDEVVAGNAALEETAVQAFCDLYRAHLELEESVLLPWALRLLEQDVLARLGGRMAARRGARPQNPDRSPSA